MFKVCILVTALLVPLTIIKGLPTEAEDEWDALDAPTKETYLDEGLGLSAPELIPNKQPIDQPAEASTAR